MRKIFTSIMLLVTVTVISAQDTQNPWHLIAFENEEEVAFYNTEMITSIEATVQNVTIALENGKKFIHPLATTTFGFDPRKEGTATANESITSLQWKVHYVNSRLHFNKTVNNISVYSMNGAFVAQFAGNYTEVSIPLASGIYIVRADSKSAILAIGANGNGNAVTQPTVEAKVINPPTPISLQSGNTIKIYWNITASNSTMSVEISNVEKFYFTTDNSIVFTFRNGNTVELEEYQGVEFSTEPSLTTNSNIDWNLTLLHCGANYDEYGNIYYSMATKDNYIVYSATSETTIMVAKSNIDDMNKFNNPQNYMGQYYIVESAGRIGAFYSFTFPDEPTIQPFIGIIYRVTVLYNDGTSGTGYRCLDLTANRNTFLPDVRFPNGCIIPSVISEKNGQITISTSVGTHTFEK